MEALWSVANDVRAVAGVALIAVSRFENCRSCPMDLAKRRAIGAQGRWALAQFSPVNPT